MSKLGILGSLQNIIERKQKGDDVDEVEIYDGRLLGLREIDVTSLKILCLLLGSNVPRGIKNTGVGKDQLRNAYQSKYGESFEWETTCQDLSRLREIRIEFASPIGERFREAGHPPSEDGFWALLDGVTTSDTWVTFEVGDSTMIAVTHELKSI